MPNLIWTSKMASRLVCIVTGGASGLGRATAELLVRRGGKVLIADLPKSDGDNIAKEIGENCQFQPTDVSIDSSFYRYFYKHCTPNIVCAGPTPRISKVGGGGGKASKNRRQGFSPFNCSFKTTCFAKRGGHGPLPSPPGDASASNSDITPYRRSLVAPYSTTLVLPSCPPAILQSVACAHNIFSEVCECAPICMAANTYFWALKISKYHPF